VKAVRSRPSDHTKTRARVTPRWGWGTRTAPVATVDCVYLVIGVGPGELSANAMSVTVPGADRQKLLDMQSAAGRAKRREAERSVAVRRYVPSFLSIKARQVETWAEEHLDLSVHPDRHNRGSGARARDRLPQPPCDRCPSARQRRRFDPHRTRFVAPRRLRRRSPR
jgi:hypothetical protein